MSRSRHISPALLSAILAFGITVAACSDQSGDATVATAPPSQRQPMDEDPRIGEGLPAEARFAGVEHNRLTMLMLRQARGRAKRTLAKQSPCETVIAGLTAESPRTAARAGIPGRADELSTVLRAFLSTHRECSGRIAQPSLSAFVGDAGVTASSHPDSVLTDASLQTIEQMISRIGSAQSLADISAALVAAAATATTLGATDAIAVQAAVAQSQGSVVLWGPGGAAWTELESAVAPQSLFRTSEDEPSFWKGFLGALTADGSGCLGGVRFMREVQAPKDWRVVGAGCGFAGAAGTIVYAYNLYHQE